MYWPRGCKAHHGAFHFLQVHRQARTEKRLGTLARLLERMGSSRSKRPAKNSENKVLDRFWNFTSTARMTLSDFSTMELAGTVFKNSSSSSLLWVLSPNNSPSLKADETGCRAIAHGFKTDPDWVMARWKSPRERGLSIRNWTEAPPALSPKMVTLSGSPPKVATFRLTHRNASTWSRKPLFPGHDWFCRLRKPWKNYVKLKLLDCNYNT